jgi:hypothetical protein
MNLELSKILIGEIDAKYELLNDTPEEKEQYEGTFYIPSNYKANDFIEGNNYFITGLKGTGKTALLRYLGLKLEHEGYLTKYILYKSQIDPDQKNDFFSASKIEMLDGNENKSLLNDYTLAWRWFIYRMIVSEYKSLQDFKSEDAYSLFEKLVSAPKNAEKAAEFWKFIPKIKKGNIEVNGDFKSIAIKCGIDFEFNETKKEINFAKLIKAMDEQFNKIGKLPNKLFILFDELEIGLPSNNMYERDCRIVKDLIITIESMNNICKAKKIPIKCIGAIRSEVIQAASNFGQEINKANSLGIRVSWNNTSSDIVNHSLLQLIQKRIEYSEKINGLPGINIWEKYFPELQQGKSIKEYILHQTWYKPRDIVRLLREIKKNFPDERKFTHNCFDAIRKDYSSECWIEVCEELAATYTSNELMAIQKLLTGFKEPFSFDRFKQLSTAKSFEYKEIAALLKRKTYNELIDDLYRVGIIGNTGLKMRFAFRGDLNPDYYCNFCFHPALDNVLAITR